MQAASNGQALSDTPALKPYWGKPAVRNFREGNGNVGIIRSPLRAIALPEHRVLRITRNPSTENLDGSVYRIKLLLQFAAFVMKGFRDQYDRAVIISGDTDLIPAIKTVRSTFPPKQIGVIVPIGKSSEDLL